MTDLIPARFLFRFSLPVLYRAELPHGKAPLLRLPAECQLAEPADLESGTSPFGTLRLGWNENGVGIRVEVHGKRFAPRCDANQLASSDGLTVWIDTRNTQNIHRASRFCHQFCALPGGALKDRTAPVARQLPIARAREETPVCDPRELGVWSDRTDTGYILELWLPTAVLQGYDPESNPRLGFYYHLRDHELGDQYLSVGAEFPFEHDPSLWWTLELVHDLAGE